MTDHLEIKTFEFNTISVQLYVPVIDAVKYNYEKAKLQAGDMHFPYWAMVWPASIALCTFLANNLSFIQNKKVLELAAGLGLPTMLAASYARAVCCSDYLQDAVDVIDQSIVLNNLPNAKATLLNWHHLPADLDADVLLLSDINYDQQEFDVLHTVLEKFIQRGTTIILTTPQRLMAKAFIAKLLPWVVRQEEIEVRMKDTAYITVLVLKK